MEGGGRCVLCQKLTDDFRPSSLYFLLADPLLETKGTEQLLDNRPKVLRGIFGEGGIGQPAPVSKDLSSKLWVHILKAKNPRNQVARVLENEVPVSAAIYSPSLPIASTGQPSIASLQRDSSSGDSGCLYT